MYFDTMLIGILFEEGEGGGLNSSFQKLPQFFCYYEVASIRKTLLLRGEGNSIKASPPLTAPESKIFVLVLKSTLQC